MDTTDLDAFRRFSRLVTARVGALDDDYLSRTRPLGLARVLWEVGRGDTEVGVLRARLGLDPAQLSRSLRALEQDGLVVVATDGQDSRVRIAALTAAGRSEWRVLDQASDASAAAILGRLDDRQRGRLVAAMGEVERLLLASLVEVAPTPPGDPNARTCLRAYNREIGSRFGTDVDPGGDERLVAPTGLLLVAMLQAEPIGCGGLRHHELGPPEVKRLWIAPSARGLGLGRRLLAELEGAAAAAGARAVRLDTNKTLTEAIALYRSAGYVEIERYNDNPHAHHWFEKQLGTQVSPSPDRGV